ncbi:MAG: hypothetical protein GPOALKHO_000764 [Sodalis sp.]|nr:MAG: hypothetical protein GPOALKHO_000764 [Sodalis sp.]
MLNRHGKAAAPRLYSGLTRLPRSAVNTMQVSDSPWYCRRPYQAVAIDAVPVEDATDELLLKLLPVRAALYVGKC